jgi:hypothetical protein
MEHNPKQLERKKRGGKKKEEEEEEEGQERYRSLK